MNFSISQYWSLFTKFTNPFSIVMTCLESAGIAFLFFFLLVIFMRKFILVKRKYVFFKILSWTYMICIPLIAAFFGFKWGLIDGVRNDLVTHMPAYTSGLDKILNDAIAISETEFESEIATGKDSANLNLSIDGAINKFSEVVYDKFGATLENNLLAKDDLGDLIVALLLDAGKSDFIAGGLKAEIQGLLRDGLGMDTGTSSALMKIKFQDLLKKGLFTSIMQVQVNHFFRGMEKGLYLFFALILAFPVAETFIANMIYRSNLKSAKKVQ